MSLAQDHRQAALAVSAIGISGHGQRQNTMPSKIYRYSSSAQSYLYSVDDDFLGDGKRFAADNL